MCQSFFEKYILANRPPKWGIRSPALSSGEWGSEKELTQSPRCQVVGVELNADPGSASLPPQAASCSFIFPGRAWELCQWNSKPLLALTSHSRQLPCWKSAKELFLPQEPSGRFPAHCPPSPVRTLSRVEQIISLERSCPTAWPSLGEFLAHF